MTRVRVGCVHLLIAVSTVWVTQAQMGFVFPPVRIQAFSPRGIRVSVPDVEGITALLFDGNINKRIMYDKGNIHGFVTTKTNGYWVLDDPTVELHSGDVINYNVLLETGKFENSPIFNGHFKSQQRYVVFNLERRSPSDTSLTIAESKNIKCNQSVTVVFNNNTPICSGQIIFEEDYGTLKEDVWQIEQYIPTEDPAYPFVSYQRSAVSVANMALHIAAKLQQTEPGFTSSSLYTFTLDLTDGCTGQMCKKQPSGADILPPVISGRITSKNFAFKYGTVIVRAKMPKGDWLYPGIINIASARGNEYLVANSKDYGRHVLYAGPIMDLKCREQLLQNKILVNKSWADNFHEYSLRWTPQYLTFSVDKEDWIHIEPGARGLVSRFPDNCTDLPRERLASSSELAPFDDLFHISLGLAVGGSTEFKDDLTTKADWPKPWRNSARKAMLNFWKDIDAWYPTWKQPELLIDYIKVIAL
ncbi:beta-1,3-glucan-binding protein-like isoform X2 [Galleria mellonella]|uniref:Beta-1,3-glucan-binding protein-like isoform X2 n=1 Tax=Galleria mellonella TaxID=7137 RepID=A0A6J1X7H1_GALME|nr:beta-1,3-glucan-binding protein-like isoform X2 [Galleria mellonella]